MRGTLFVQPNHQILLSLTPPHRKIPKTHNRHTDPKCPPKQEMLFRKGHLLTTIAHGILAASAPDQPAFGWWRTKAESLTSGDAAPRRRTYVVASRSKLSLPYQLCSSNEPTTKSNLPSQRTVGSSYGEEGVVRNFSTTRFSQMGHSRSVSLG